MDNEFSARVRNGKVQWNRPEAARDFIASLEGKRIKIIIEEPDRTKAQNRQIHALFTELSRQLGYSPAAWKEYLKEIWMAEPESGTSGMNVSEAGEFIEFCLSWAATEMDIHL